MLETQNFNLTEADYQRLQQGDQRLQTKVFDKYASGFVHMACNKFNMTAEDAEEIVSSAFAKLFYKILTSGVTLDNLQGYVFTIVRHKCIELSAQKKKNIVETRDEMPDNAEQELDNDALQAINKAFNLLGTRCRQLLSDFYWENKDHKDIATELGITEEASRQRKRECMKKLKIILLNLPPNS